MNLIFILLPLATLLSLSFLVALLVSIKSGQYDDVDVASMRILFSEKNEDDKN